MSIPFKYQPLIPNQTDFTDGIMGVVQHLLYINELEEEHQLHRQDCVILGAYLRDLGNMIGMCIL